MVYAFLQSWILVVDEDIIHLAAKLFNITGRKRQTHTDALVAACAICAEPQARHFGNETHMSDTLSIKHRNRLITLLKELFQLDQPELDFGLYKVMHARAERVTQFLEHDLLAEIEAAFGEADDNRLAEAKAAWEAKRAEAESLGAPEPDNAPAVKEAKAAWEAAKDGGNSETEIYDHLYRFFERYYDKGDFMSRRYYARESDSRAAPYAVPYDGREVYLHWANKDQYYIKSSEYLTNYSFDLNEAVRQLAKQNKGSAGWDFDPADSTPRKVHFRIVDGSEGEHGNVKEADSDKRKFVPFAERPAEVDEQGELVLNFQYKALPGGKYNFDEAAIKAQYGNLNKGDLPLYWMANTFLEAIDTLDDLSAAYRQQLRALAPTDKQKKRPLLVKYINKYTSRHSMDYFIHKDLGGFLRRELDFYIKNEIMQLDAIEQADAPQVKSYLAKIKVLRRIAHQLIDFLAQLENFQKKLWLKKKFVTETHYGITLDRVPESLYAEIAANNAQRQEWCELFHIEDSSLSKNRGDLHTPAYSEPLTVEFLKANPFLVLDTKHFSDDFKARLINEIDDFDEQCDGLLVQGDNFHSLELLSQRNKGTVKSVYLDPPYNTNVSAIPYKNSYRHSSWATLMRDRLKGVCNTMMDASACYVSIDKHERRSLEAAMDDTFGAENKVEELIWSQNTNDGRSPTFSTNHEYIEVYAKNLTAAEDDYGMFREPKPGFEEVMELVAKLNPDYPSCDAIEAALRELYTNHRKSYREDMEQQGIPWDEAKRNNPWSGTYQYKFAEYRDTNGRFVEEAEAAGQKASIWVFRESDWTIMESDQKQSASTKDPNDPNYRYYQPTHPVTGKPCRMPSRGWKGTLKRDPEYPDRNSWESMMEDHRMAVGKDESKVPQQKRFLHEVDSNVAKSIVVDYADGERETSDLFGRKGVFLAPKHSNFVSRFIFQSSRKDSTILDIFGGSGSTASAVINCNRMDDGKRRFILMEANRYFDTIIIRRIKKSYYASDWDNGRPQSKDRISHCFKYLRLESYEDALNNLVLRNDANRDRAIDNNANLRRDYLLNYFLDVETQGSQSLLNVGDFRDPTAYTMKIKQPGSDESREQAIDLVETFNWLIGLWVEHLAAPQTFAGEFKREKDAQLPDDENTRLVCSRLKRDQQGDYWFRLVEGYTLKVPGDKTSKSPTLVIWRKLTDDAEADNAALQKYLEVIGVSSREQVYDTIYVNGSHTLPNPVVDGENTKVKLLEEAFHHAMWSEA